MLLCLLKPQAQPAPSPAYVHMGSLSQRTDPSSHKNYKNVPILVTLPAAMTVHQARHYLQKEGVSLAYSLGICSRHGGEGMVAGTQVVSWSQGSHRQEAERGVLGLSSLLFLILSEAPTHEVVPATITVGFPISTQSRNSLIDISRGLSLR